MSYHKNFIDTNIIKPTQAIKNDSLIGCSFEEVIEALDILTKMHEYLCKNHKKPFEKMWNEIVNDSIAVIYNILSGFYHTANVSMRCILEIGCSSFYFFDHQVEYYLYEYENAPMDKYVSSLVNEYSFFTTKYIKAFNTNIDSQQSNPDSVSTKLKAMYKFLCDVVHGRYTTLTKVDSLTINFNRSAAERSKQNFLDIIGMFAVMYELRFSTGDQDIIKWTKKMGVLK